ncbi:unnamed protein product [marine sediment metagenome]|uniref:Uncharacterized protein n=1 Tax=marine sediment metagenome TaxID=412755 RepID=X1IXJ8_9ZZZZ
MNYDPNCSLCRKDKLAPQPYADEICWETVCPLHGQVMLVLNDHRPQPTPEEWVHIKEVATKRHPDKKFRGEGMHSMPQHWHEHLV